MQQNPAVALFLALGVIIAASRIGGTIARRFGQPRVLGELIVGVVLGPTALDLLHAPLMNGVDLHETIAQLAELGVLLLMFIVGLEVNVKELAKVGKIAVIAGFSGALLPVLFTLPIVLLFGYAWQPALFAGVTLAATSVSISAQVLLELGVLRTKVGNALLATALIDDVIAILLVSLAVATSGSGGAASGEIGALVGIIVRMAVYLAGAFLLAWFVLPRMINWLARQPTVRQSYGIPAIALLLALLFGWSAETLGGVAAITGAFIAGVGFSRVKDDVRHEIEVASSSIAYAFLVPIFFINVGLGTNLRTFPLSGLPLAGLLLVAALVSKIGGCGLGARLGGFTNHEALQLGVCMISRGEVGLIIASLGLSIGIFPTDQPLFASLFLVILLTTVVTPILVRQVFPEEREDGMKLIVLITARVEDGLDIAQAWHEAGAPGATIIRSHGLHTLQNELKSGSVELPRMVVSMGAAMAAVLDTLEARSELILSLVEDDLVDPLIAAANEVLGDLTEPNHGVLFVLPIERALGVRRHDGT